MRAVILSAGRGSRLLPLTEFLPKCLVPIDGVPLLDRQLQGLAEAGFDAATVVAGYRHERVANHLAQNAPAIPVELRYNPFWAVSSSIGSVWAARDLLRDPFCLINGDTSFAPELLARALHPAAGSVGLMVEPLVRAARDDMLVRVEDGAVVAVSKALEPRQATHRSMGAIVAGAESAYADALAAVIGAPNGIQAYHHDVVDALSRSARVSAIVDASGDWVEIDCAEDIEQWQARA